MRGELTITKVEDKFTYFGYKKEITEDAAYDKAVNDWNAGTAYDIFNALDKTGQVIMTAGIALSSFGVPVVGVPLMEIGGAVGLSADAIEITTDLTQGKIGYAIAKSLFNVPDRLAGGLLKKTLIPEVSK